MSNKEVVKVTKITPEQAEGFLSELDDQLNTPVTYFTLTPSTSEKYPASEGWEDVRYYTNRSRYIKMPTGVVNCQWIYILSNETMPGLVKIGFTKNKPSERVKQINSATGVALDFKVEWAYPCFNAHDLEKEIHYYLEGEGFRVNKKKEFFNISLEQARSVVERIGEPYKMEDNEE